jgi:hypothetical protein
VTSDKLSTDSVTNSKIDTGAVGNNEIADGAVTNSKLSTASGEPGVWTSWTPTWTNLTVGNGAHVARYTQVGKLVTINMRFTLGSTSSVGTGPYFTIPVQKTTDPSFINGVAEFRDATGAFWFGFCKAQDSTHMSIVGINGATTGSQWLNITATSPMTWASGDIISVMATYEAA